MSITETLDGVAVTTKANVYFDGKCISHSVRFADGTGKSVGVILPASLTFSTGAPEVMEGVAGRCRVRLKGADGQPGDWHTYGAGESYNVPGNSSFDIEVSGEPYHYICHFG
jgi:purine/pyrimidine-nucleoside phosphorylase